MRSYDDYEDSLREDDRQSIKSLERGGLNSRRSAETRSVRSQASRLTRTPSPLIPSEASYRDDEYDDRQASPVQEDDAEFDDPKYQAHRNSLLLEHPQPRQGPTSRHQNNLETKAHAFGDDSATASDLSQQTVSDFDPAMWGSAGAAALNRNRFSTAETSSPNSMGSPRTNRTKDEGSLIPPLKTQQQSTPLKAAPKASYDQYDDEDDEDDWEPQYSNSGFAKNKNANMYYSSPLGSGHLLEPIQEVRYSLETDSGHVSRLSPFLNFNAQMLTINQISPEPQVSSARAVDMRQHRRNITGPRPMGSRSPGPQTARVVENTGTIRRKPVRGSQGTT